MLALEFAWTPIWCAGGGATWDDISKLAVIATIRTLLNYFLANGYASSTGTGIRRKSALY